MEEDELSFVMNVSLKEFPFLKLFLLDLKCNNLCFNFNELYQKFVVVKVEYK